jgi:hypothetical protein
LVSAGDAVTLRQRRRTTLVDLATVLFMPMPLLNLIALDDPFASSVPWLAVTREAGRSWCLRARLHGGCTQAGQRRCDQSDEDSEHLDTDVDGHGHEQDDRRDDGPAVVLLDRPRRAHERPRGFQLVE